jgi:hypothetical protein
MLKPHAEMPDEAMIYVLVASRVLSESAQHALTALVDRWGQEWSGECPACSASHAQTMLDGWVVAWAAHDPARQPAGSGYLSGGDFDPLFRTTELFAAEQTPPLSLAFGEGFLVDGEVLPLNARLRELLQAGRITRDTLFFYTSPVAVWRAGRFIHRLGDDAEWLAILGEYVRS